MAKTHIEKRRHYQREIKKWNYRHDNKIAPCVVEWFDTNIDRILIAEESPGRFLNCVLVEASWNKKTMHQIGLISNREIMSIPNCSIKTLAVWRKYIPGPPAEPSKQQREAQAYIDAWDDLIKLSSPNL